MSKTYVYDDGQFVGQVRKISGGSIGISIPQEIRRTLGLYPGSRIMVHVEKVKPRPKETEGEE